MAVTGSLAAAVRDLLEAAEAASEYLEPATPAMLGGRALRALDDAIENVYALFARQQLRALARIEKGTATDTPRVVFLCVHNAGRSQMALGWFNHLAGDRAVGWSGGSEPGTEINPAAVEAMAEVGIEAYPEFK